VEGGASTRAASFGAFERAKVEPLPLCLVV